jgi:hypothetical protein
MNDDGDFSVDSVPNPTLAAADSLKISPLSVVNVEKYGITAQTTGFGLPQ